MSASLAIFAKAAIPGCVKTRLVPPLTAQEAARFARVSLEVSLRRFTPAVGGVSTLFLEGAADAEVRSLAAELGLAISAQANGDLGARLGAAFAGLRAEGASKILAIGSDSPTLNPTWITDAVLALDHTDVVIGPAEDGGYYLVGVRGDVDEIFAGIPWSTGKVAEVTVERARALGLSVHMLPAWYDVDDAASLQRAYGDSRSRIPALEEFIDSVRGKLGPR